MSARVRQFKVPAVFCAVVGGVWTLGSVKAELDMPFRPSTHVDPAVIERARRAMLESDTDSYRYVMYLADVPAASPYAG